MHLIFQSSPWWLLACVLVGGVYAFGLYGRWPIRAARQQAGLSRRVQMALGAVRWGLVTLLCLLLLNPLIRSLQTVTEKPIVAIAIDNSASMVAAGRGAVNPALDALEQLRQQLTNSGKEVVVQTLDKETQTSTPLGQLAFTQRTTNLSDLMNRIRLDYEGRNLTDVILLSDGIVNQGLSPTYGQYPFRVQAVGVGDTLPKKDVQLKSVIANRIAYLGNQFPIQVEVSSYGFSGKNATVLLRQNGQEISRQAVSFGRNETFETRTFQVTASRKGVQRYDVLVVPQAGEFSTQNNRQDVFIDVVDGREKVLLLALAPHPDVKAIRAILAKNQNYEVDVRVLTGSATPMPPPAKTYDLLILHQLPDRIGVGNAALTAYLAKPTPVLYVLGNQSGVGVFNTSNPVLQIAAPGNQTDKVTGVYNPNFRQVNLNADQLTLLAKLPPLQVPYGDYKLQPGSEVVMWQQVSQTRTNRPLLALNLTGSRKAAALVGEGFWNWRLEEYALTNKQEVVDELLLKIMQLISVREDRRKLRVYPIRNEFMAGESVQFETELYNDIYERLYNQPIRLTITDEHNKVRSYTYSPSESDSRFSISQLPPGVYGFHADATLNGKKATSDGQFIVRDMPLEASTTTADFTMLRQLATQTGGKFYKAAQVQGLLQQLQTQPAPARLSSNESLNELIHWRWLFFVLLLLATVEWATRKYQGSY